MAIRIVRLGTERYPGEGTRIGSVRRPPRGVPKSEFASGNWYDVWYPELAPSVDTMKLGQTAGTDKDWQVFVKRFRSEMAEPSSSRSLDVLAALSQHSSFSLGCYCENEARCHRSILRQLLAEKGAQLADDHHPG